MQQILLPLSYLRHVPLSSAKSGQLVSTLTQCQQELLIFHFGGHADGEQLQFRDAGGQVAGLAENLSLHPQLKLVFLNGCNTQAQAVQYLDAGVPAVIATTCSIADGQAMQFAKVFYTALTKGHTLEEAFSRAKGSMKLKDGVTYEDEILNWREVRLREEQIVEMPWRLYVAGDEVLGWKLEMADYKVKSPPILLNNVPTNFDPKTDCIGREIELAELHQKLKNSPKVALVRGLGGIGKTTLVQAYLVLHQEQYRHIAWITQGEDFINAVVLDVSLAENLKIPLHPGEDLATHFVRLMQALRALPGPNLLVIDNATEQLATRKVFEQLPKAPNWKVLVTSRQDLPDFVVMELQVLQPEATLQLFRFYYQGGSNEEVRELLREIGYHTLTAELLARTLQRKKGLLSIPKLLDILHNQQLDDPKLVEKIWARHSGEEHGVFKYLMGLYTLADLSAEEVWVLQQFAVLPTLPLKVSMLAKWLGVDADDLNQVLNELVDKGWLSTQKEGFVVHRLIQELIKYQQAPGLEELDVLVNSMANKMSFDPYGNPVTENFPWVPYAENVAEYFRGQEVLPERVNTLWNNLANVLKHLGDYSRAAQLFDLVLTSAIHNFGEDHPTVAVSQSNLGLVLGNLGGFPRALELLELALNNALRNFGDDHPEVAWYRSNLASIVSDLGDYPRATKLLELALDSALHNFGEDHPEVAMCRSNLALVLRDSGDYHRALELLELALGSALRNFTEDHPNVAVCRSNLADVLRHLGQYERAAQLFKFVLESNLRNYGKNHPEVAKSQSNLGLVLRDLGQSLLAAKYFELALKNNLRNFGENHPHVAVCQSNLGLVFCDLMRWSEAAQLFKTALDSNLGNFGEDHPNVAASRSNLGLAFCELGDFNNAIYQLELSLVSDLHNFGEDNPHVAASRWKLASIYHRTGQSDKAKVFLEQALPIIKKNLGVNHSYYIEIVRLLNAVNKKLNTSS
ncbi:MAG: tetratricopeptide repeat protein [Haliscomenobacter sp.]|uniref:tetratricopeptide repeat protein n=1 Tax=Haliscomenobacter sp. TaxID=2717303 RepID=UPI0029BD19CC|nr:tetratricopeptide repeat protein [Haliscomenobacter sp.]MDX2071719.1 tetratricopeptide repeat protein [Haliscomenobacter sp.]